MDPPSPQLIARLTGSGLCQPRDLRRCRARVRRLARDVPLFETVWLDALVQTRKLTAFQAELLAADHPEQVSVGPFILMNRIGDDGRFVHFQARRRDAAVLYQLSRTRDEPESPLTGAERLQAFRDRTASITHPGLALLHGFEHVDDRLWVASPWTPGTTLQQLVVRRGRFAPACVAAVGLQLCDALAALGQASSLHGDLRLRNVKLTPRGVAVLLVPGLRSAFFPEQSIHVAVPPDDCDGIAPELIGTGQPATLPSEAYALGCLFWELLAGRPPFPHGDPLAKLAAHQTQRIPDIRDWAPDTPAGLAELVRQLTQPNPADRPQTWREISEPLQRARRATRRQLVRFIRGDTTALPVSRVELEPSRAPATALAATVVLLAAGSLLLMHSGARTELLNITRRTPAPAAAAPDSAATVRSPDAISVTASQLPPLPAPDSRGIIELHGPGPYAARDVSGVGKLVIRGVGNVRPAIEIDERPMRISTEQLILENVELRRSGTARSSAEPDPGSLLHVEVRQFVMRRCRFDNGDAAGAAIEWKLLDADAATPGNGIVAESVFIGRGPAVRASEPPSSVAFDNVLHCGSAALLEFASREHQRRPIDVELRSVTMRGSGPVVACRIGDASRLQDSLTLTLVDSVCALEGAALIELLGPDAPADWQRLLCITGESSVVPGGAAIAGLRIAPDRLRPLPTDEVSIDGLMTADLKFAGPADGTPANSALVGTAGYSRSGRPPGIDPAKLPAPSPTAYNSDVPMESAARGMSDG